MTHFVSSTKQIVAVAVTPNIGLEVAVLDKKSPTVVKYGRQPLEYNISTREIQDYDAFRTALVSLFKELDINTKSNVYLVLPNVHLDFESLPSIIGDEGVNNAILSKAEDFYIFKRVEPVSAWADLVFNNQSDKRLVVYSSFQETAISQIKDIFEDIGATLLGIETSYSAILRGIYFTDAAGDDVDENVNWNLLLVNSNSYALFAMQGTRLIDYTEVPLAIKTFSYEEAYQAISTSVSQILPNFPAKKLMILSQAEDICAEVLKTQIVFDNEVVTHDCNKYSKTPPINIASSSINEGAAAITFSLIGALALEHTEQKVLQLNVLDKSGISGEAYFSFEFQEKEIYVTKELAQKALMALSGLLALVFAAVFGLFNLLEGQVQKNVKKLKTQTETIRQQVEGINAQSGLMDINSLIKRTVETNKKVVDFYDSIATDIPQSVWLQYYYNKDGDKLSIEGVSANINDIYAYYKSLKVISPQSSIKLNNLQILAEFGDSDFDFAAPDVGNKFYSFEISNVKSPKNIDEETQKAAAEQAGNPNQKTNSRARTPRTRSNPQQQVPDLTPPPQTKLEPVDINN